MKQFIFILAFATSLSLTASMTVISYIGIRLLQLPAPQPALVALERPEDQLELQEAA